MQQIFSPNANIKNLGSTSSIHPWLLFDNSNVGALSSEVVITNRASQSLDANGGAPKTSCEVSETVSVVVYIDAAASSTLKIAAVDVSGDTPVLGTAVTVSTTSSGSTGKPTVKKVSSTKVLLAYVTDSGVLTLKSYTISGTTLTLDATATGLNNGAGSVVATACLAVMSSTKAMVISGDGNTAKLCGVSIGSGSLAIDTTNTLDYDATADNVDPEVAPWGLETLGDGTHCILVHPGTNSNYALVLVSLTSYGSAPTSAATLSSFVDYASGPTVQYHATILVASTSRVYIGLFIRSGTAMFGTLMPFNIDTGSPAITAVQEDNSVFNSVGVPYGFCGGAFLGTVDGKDLLIIAGSIRRKRSSSLPGNFTAILYDDDDALMYKTMDFAGTNSTTIRDCEIIKVSSTKILLCYPNATNQYPALRIARL